MGGLYTFHYISAIYSVIHAFDVDNSSITSCVADSSGDLFQSQHSTNHFRKTLHLLVFHGYLSHPDNIVNCDQHARLVS